MTRRTRKRLLITCLITLVLAGVTVSQFPEIGAALILHPPHRRVTAPPPPLCHEVTFQGDGAPLRGWRGHASGNHRGTLIYLHGVADNRAGGAGVINRFQKRGFDVIAYDSRAHGESGGDACTYGYFEKEDLRRVLDTVRPGPVVLVGSSLGAAVALQLTGTDERVSAVVAAEPFSDLRTVVTERAPFFFTSTVIGKAIELAGHEGRFLVDSVSPEAAARAIMVPTLVIHGAADTDTPPDHARRVFAALGGPKRLILVPGAGHNESLQGTMWAEIERWIDEVLASEPHE
ncbi:MAG: alpha/beta fold hydrolase [Verrucomicrobiota bacterium]